ncbi:NERD domain-containing protein [Piscibacillus halophilus]|uniref:Nuclease-related domain-containing protein n=1 Tax=Piscibacillus halophilus TaxID=571933 RepID=A0A1H9FH67_9BACI|nr:NERD domain-containing protein [Piscibacillus halophilus]SEQ36658.1 hypothetical protein SAMN05216362_11212 [Piscibacillus halophilus]
MAQLIKLKDYISRYETGMFRYPGQFIRMKKEQYDKLIYRWEQEKHEIDSQESISTDLEEDKKSFFNRLFNRKKVIDVWDDEEEQTNLPENEQDLKYYFLDEVFSTQLKWASSTLQEVSYFDQSYERDPWLKYFLQRFPDTYLVFYQPIFKLKKATIEGEVIILTPTELMCISILDRRYSNTTFKPIDDRKWLAIEGGQEKTIVNPVIDLKRMERLLKSILDYYELDFPVKKYLFAKSNQIAHQSVPYQTEFIDQDDYESWFQKQRQSTYPIKAQQLKVGEKLLEHTQRTYVKRPVWVEDESPVDEGS